MKKNFLKVIETAGRIWNLSKSERNHLEKLSKWFIEEIEGSEQKDTDEKVITENFIKIVTIYLQSTKATKEEWIRTGKKEDGKKHRDKCRNLYNWGTKKPEKSKNLINFYWGQINAVKNLMKMENKLRKIADKRYFTEKEKRKYKNLHKLLYTKEVGKEDKYTDWSNEKCGKYRALEIRRKQIIKSFLSKYVPEFKNFDPERDPLPKVGEIEKLLKDLPSPRNKKIWFGDRSTLTSLKKTGENLDKFLTTETRKKIFEISCLLAYEYK